jgi:hypothetical protein
LIRFWCDEYERRVGAKYPFQGGKDGKTVKWLLELYSYDDACNFMASFFEMDDDFIQNSGYGLGVFRGCLPKVIQQVKRGQRPDRNGHVPQCATITDCNRKLFADAKKAREAS